MGEATTGAGDPPERALMLRLWREGDGVGAVWRCSVEDPRTKQRRGFSSIAELIPFLDLFTRGFESVSLPDVSRKAETETQARAGQS
jgi:hypothetical protein